MHDFSLPDHARLWLFAAAADLPDRALRDVQAFLPTWASHGRPVTAEAAVLSPRVLAVAALISPEEFNAGVSGCGIDAMTHAVEHAFAEAGVRQPGALAVTFHDGSAWREVPRAQFRARARAGEVNGDTRVLDLTPTTLGALRRAGGVERRAAEAWHGRAFGLADEGVPAA